MAEQEEPGPTDAATCYVDEKDRTLFVSDGLSRGEYWFTVYQKTKNSGTHRLKSPALPIRSTREEAQADLDEWAKKKNLKPDIQEGTEGVA